MNSPIMFTEEFWKNSHFSVARFYGRIDINGAEYVIVDKRGVDIFKLSEEAEKAGRAKAIEPGEPCDLVRRDWTGVYKRLGREKFIELCERLQNEHSPQALKEAREQSKKK